MDRFLSQRFSIVHVNEIVIDLDGKPTMQDYEVSETSERNTSDSDGIQTDGLG